MRRRHHPRGASYRGGELAESETLLPATGAPVPEMRVTVTVVGGPPAGGEGCVVEIVDWLASLAVKATVAIWSSSVLPS